MVTPSAATRYADRPRQLLDQESRCAIRKFASVSVPLSQSSGATIANIRPDLYRAIVADVPFVDIITTLMAASIPLTAQEWQQWGDPHNAEQYAYMKSYSPYDNVARKAYPWMLVTTSLNDSQVGFWEPAKWVAKLRSMKTDTNPLYIKINMAGGHGGSSGRYDVLRERAFRYAFMLNAVGISR
jgi:oligopeptidase B